MANIPAQPNQSSNATPVYSQGDDLLRKVPVFFVALFVVTTVGVFSYFLGTQRNDPSDYNSQNITSEAPIQPSPISETQEKIVPPNTTLTKHTIPEANLTFLAPSDLEVTYEVVKNQESNEPTGITLYVQKNNGDITKYYQLYGLYQFELNGDLEGRKGDMEPATLQETTVSGFPALEGQIKGQRNRFVTYIKTDRGLLSLFTAEPTPENKALSDQIIDTFVLAQ